LVPVILLGKSFDTSCPLGPWLTTKDEVGDPQNLKMQLRLNGELRQDANTSDMICGVRDLVSWWSNITLEPGDVIAAAAVFCCWAWRPRRRGSRRAREARA
jgi:acylpyruvate hydrolase